MYGDLVGEVALLPKPIIELDDTCVRDVGEGDEQPRGLYGFECCTVLTLSTWGTAPFLEPLPSEVNKATWAIELHPIGVQ